MFYLPENLKKYRIMNNLTQEDVAAYLGVTPQSVSKWERSECYPDITLLPALANIFETSIDMLVGMDTVRAQETLYNIHSKATDFQRAGDYVSAEREYREALKVFPKDSGILLGLTGTLALQGDSEEAICLIERGLPLSGNEKQNATMRALLCFLYLKCSQNDKANSLASQLPHTRESREVIQPLIQQNIEKTEINNYIRLILLGE